METFYRFLGGPRTFWGGGNRTIINNNFIGGMPFSYGFGHPMPIFGGHNCCGGGVPSAFKWMLGFGLASSLVGGIMNTATQSNNNNVTSYNHIKHTIHTLIHITIIIIATIIIQTKIYLV